jgi:hypothetical protein
MKAPHLVVYDYGTGGVWAIITAESASAISRRYPLLTVVEQRPPWMTDVEYQRISATHSYDLDQQPDDFLQTLAAEHR